MIASVENSNTHSKAVFREDLNSVLSLFNQALKNEHDAGNWMCTTTNVFSLHHLNTLILLKVLFNLSLVVVMQYKTKSVMRTKNLQQAPHLITVLC